MRSIYIVHIADIKRRLFKNEVEEKKLLSIMIVIKRNLKINVLVVIH